MLHQLATSDYFYVYSEGRSVNTEAGWREMGATHSNENLDVNDDWRYLSGKRPSDRPPKGIADFIAVDSGAVMVDQETKSQRVSLPAIAFHELAEAYGKIDLGRQYVYNASRGAPDPGIGGAYAYAIRRELILLGQRPGFTEYPAGGHAFRLP